MYQKAILDGRRDETHGHLRHLSALYHSSSSLIRESYTALRTTERWQRHDYIPYEGGRARVCVASLSTAGDTARDSTYSQNDVTVNGVTATLRFAVALINLHGVPK